MITEQDLQEAIAECIGQRNPTASTCIKLAAFYAIKNELYPSSKPIDVIPQGYSYASESAYDSGSEFSDCIKGKPNWEVMKILDELMSTLQVLQPNLYNGVLRKIDSL